MLANPAFIPHDIIAAEDLCRDWFANAADVPSFVFRSIFRDLILRDFDDPQAVPTADWQRFIADVLPRMVAVLDALPGDTGAEVRALVLGYHSTI